MVSLIKLKVISKKPTLDIVLNVGFVFCLIREVLMEHQKQERYFLTFKR